MPITVAPLSDTKCQSSKFNQSGAGNKLFDGGGLYLELKSSGSKSWRMKYRKPNGKEDKLVFGDYPALSLQKARELREWARALLADGIDPKEQKREDEVQRRQALGNTFEAVARQWHNSMRPGWKPGYADIYLGRLEDNLFPEIGKRPIAALKARDLIIPIRKIEKRAPTLAVRMVIAMRSIMSYAALEGFIDTNPANDLAGAVKQRKEVHRAALPLDRLPELIGRIDSYSGRELTRLTARLTLLIFIRSSELRFARWSEINLERAEWTIPGEREPIEGEKHSERGAKMGTPHLVPLSRQAIEVLRQIHDLTGNGELVFRGDHNPRRAMSENTINKALRKMGYDTQKDVCGHGFRTMACSSLIQSKLWQEDAVERQMSHQDRDNVRRSYTHAAEFLQERRLMMQWWADYLDANRQQFITALDYAHPTADNVVTLKAM